MLIQFIQTVFRKNSFGFPGYVLSGFLALLLFAGCAKSLTLPDGPDTSSQQIVLDRQTVEIMVGEEATIGLSLDNGLRFVKKFDFSSSNPEVAVVERQSAYSVKVKAKYPGTTEIKFTSEDNSVTLSSTVTVKDLPRDGVTRILAIGNSFSEDAIENYLYNIATAAGDSIIIGNLYIGGSSLEDHLTNARENRAAYSYRKISKLGNKVTTNDVRMEDALTDENWDYISFQQVSQLSGQFSSYENTLPELLNYVKSKVTYYRTKYILHQTWAYAQNSTHVGFANYNNDQMTMYNGIMDASQKAKALGQFSIVVPAGTAIQNGRTSFMGDNFTRDGYHLNLNIGRYLAASTWYEALFNKSVINNPYDATGFMLSSQEIEMAQHAAHAAVLNPFQITDMTDFKTINFSDFTTAVFVDVAQEVQVAGWNGLTSPMENTSIPFLRDADGNLTNASLTITERFNNVNKDGAQTTNTEFNMPSSVSRNSYYGNSKGAFGGLHIIKSVIKISNLDPAKNYSLCFFGSRNSAEKRQTKYISTGANEVAAYLNTGSNTSNIACTDNVMPDANGNIFITVTAGENNDNNLGFYYLNAFRIRVQ